MNTYIFAERNGNAVITLSAEDQSKAGEYLTEVVKYPAEWRLDEEMGED